MARLYDLEPEFLADFFLHGFFDVSGSPIASSTTERASRFMSVGFCLAFFFLAVGFGMLHDARAVQLSLSLTIEPLPVP